MLSGSCRYNNYMSRRFEFLAQNGYIKKIRTNLGNKKNKDNKNEKTKKK